MNKPGCIICWKIASPENPANNDHSMLTSAGYGNYGCALDLAVFGRQLQNLQILLAALGLPSFSWSTSNTMRNRLVGNNSSR
jgi:hypothetical protein